MCELCERDIDVTRHHLIPQCRHKNKKNKKSFDRKDVKKRILMICRDCHSQIHVLFTEKELEFEFNTLEKLLGEERVQKYLKWIKGRSVNGKIRMKKSRK
jgi:hypothetical protein